MSRKSGKFTAHAISSRPEEPPPLRGFLQIKCLLKPSSTFMDRLPAQQIRVALKWFHIVHWHTRRDVTDAHARFWKDQVRGNFTERHGEKGTLQYLLVAATLYSDQLRARHLGFPKPAWIFSAQAFLSSGLHHDHLAGAKIIEIDDQVLLDKKNHCDILTIYR